jgi:hypothetical protein
MTKGRRGSHAKPNSPSQGAIWRRLIGPDRGGDLSPEAARFFLGLSFNEEDVARMHELAAKAREGTLTEAERGEIANYEHVGSVLSLLKAKSRVALKNRNAL